MCIRAPKMEPLPAPIMPQVAPIVTPPAPPPAPPAPEKTATSFGSANADAAKPSSSAPPGSSGNLDDLAKRRQGISSLRIGLNPGVRNTDPLNLGI